MSPLTQQSNSVQDELSSNILQGDFQNVAEAEVVTEERVVTNPESNDECIPVEGLDSDDECSSPFYDVVAGEIQEEGESDDNEAEPLPSANPVTPSLTEAEIKKMMMAQLQQELKRRKLSTNVSKAVLQGRLLGAIDAPAGTKEQERHTKEHDPHFAPGAKWKQLSINSEPILEPNRTATS